MIKNIQQRILIIVEKEEPIHISKLFDKTGTEYQYLFSNALWELIEQEAIVINRKHKVSFNGGFTAMRFNHD